MYNRRSSREKHLLDGPSRESMSTWNQRKGIIFLPTNGKPDERIKIVEGVKGARWEREVRKTAETCWANALTVIS